MWARRGLTAAVALLLVQLASAYYLPGTYPQEFRVGDPLAGECGTTKGLANSSLFLPCPPHLPDWALITPSPSPLPACLPRSGDQLPGILRDGDALRPLLHALLQAGGGREEGLWLDQPRHDPAGHEDRDLAVQLFDDGELLGKTCALDALHSQEW